MISVLEAVSQVLSRRHARSVDKRKDQRPLTASIKSRQDLGITTNAELHQQCADPTNPFIQTSSTQGS